MASPLKIFGRFDPVIYVVSIRCCQANPLIPGAFRGRRRICILAVCADLIVTDLMAAAAAMAAPRWRLECWTGLLRTAGGPCCSSAPPRLGLLARLEPSPHVQTEIKGPGAIAAACQVRPPWRRPPRCSNAAGARGAPALDPCTSKRGGGLKTRRNIVFGLRERIIKHQATPTTFPVSSGYNQNVPV